MIDMSLNQSMIARMAGITANQVSRTVVAKKIDHLESERSHDKRYDIETIRKITNLLYADSRRPIQQKINVFYNFKGGTGKTSLCYQVATHLALLGFKVLALDLDPQAHLSLAMQIPEDYNGPTIYDVLINNAKLDEAIINIFPGLDLLPANISMTRIEVPLSSKTKREEKLAEILVPYKKIYDYIILDTNPTISTLNMNALVASDRVNIVCETQPFSLAGLRVLVEELSSFYKDMRIEPNYCIIPNKYEIKTAMAQEVLGSLRSEYGPFVINAIVRKSEEINVSSKKRMPLSAFCKSRSTAFEDVLDLLHEIVRQSQIPYSKRMSAA